ncbi:membrane hypothetical protein [Verrucomicrobia bacterium]|nr:membrane hypothetical protein [Verrucomicrobiota bacterium]
MKTLFLNAGLLSLDSLIVSLALSPLVRSQAQRWRWAALFGLCDGLAVVIGFGLGAMGSGPPLAHRAVPLFILGCGIYCLVAAAWNKFRADPRLAVTLPILMSFDNFAYGMGIDPLASNLTAHALLLGLASFSLAMLGLSLGGLVRFPNRRTMECSAGFALVACFVLFLSV